jgi:Protein of unknown function (DUF4242)
MPEFLVELYVAHDDHGAARQQAERADQAAAELTRQGRPVQCLRSIFVPEDETCFLLYEAPAIEAVEDAVRRAGLPLAHVSAAESASAPDPAEAPPRPGPSH